MLGEPVERLEQEGGLAHARIAAEQDQGAGHQATPEDPVELGQARREAIVIGGLHAADRLGTVGGADRAGRP